SSQCVGQDEDLAQKLRVVSLSDRENNLTNIEKGDIKISNEECNRSLFGKVIGDRRASWVGIKRSMTNIWKLQQALEIKELGPNYFQFIFQNKEDLLRVSKGTNWIFDNQYLILAEWRNDLSISHNIFTELNIWVQAFNVPLNWLSTEVGLKIGGVFKKVNNVVVVGAGSHGGRLMRLLVTVDLNEALPRCSRIRLDDQLVTVGFKYEKLVNHCHYCGFIGHLERSCLKRLDDIQSKSLTEGQFGDWMRAPDFLNWANLGHSTSRNSPPSHTHSTPVPSQATPINTSTSHVEDNNQIIPALEDSPIQSSMPQPTSDHPAPMPPNPSKPSSSKSQPPDNSLMIVDNPSDPNLNTMDLDSTQLLITYPSSDIPITQNLIPKIGLGGPSTVSQLRESIRTHHPSFTFISETKNKSSFVKSVVKKMGFDHRFAIVDPQGQSGGLLLLWQSDITILQSVSKDFYIAVQFQGKDAAKSWGIFVYLSSEKHTREQQWAELTQDKSLWGDSWFIIGDWNDIRFPEDKRGGRDRGERSLEGFNDFICSMEMEEIAMLGYPYTWANNRISEEFVEVKLDRAFASLEWIEQHSNASVLNVIRGASDHSMLLLDYGKAQPRLQRRFTFDKRWLEIDGCAEIVKKAWSTHHQGTPLFILKEKVKCTRIALLHWSSQFRKQRLGRINELTTQLEALNEEGRDKDWDAWDRIKRDLNEAHRHEEQFWQQKARHKWLKHGDCNSSFFHAYVRHRRKTNSISRLVDRSNMVYETHSEIESHVTAFYKNLFASEVQCLLSVFESFRLYTGQKVNLFKSSIFFSRNSPVALQDRICNHLPGISKHNSTRYLGLPLGIGKSKKEAFEY
ncbi:Unknown protein, partial [Striga hermonthica]